MFDRDEPFNVLLIQAPSERVDSFDFDDFTTFSERIKKST